MLLAIAFDPMLGVPTRDPADRAEIKTTKMSDLHIVSSSVLLFRLSVVEAP